MFAIINGLRYDAETADFLAEASHGHLGDFDAWTASLYLSPGGRYFLAGHGGPASLFKRQVEQRAWSAGSKIIAMSPEEALACAEKELPARKVVEIFEDTIGDA